MENNINASDLTSKIKALEEKIEALEEEKKALEEEKIFLEEKYKEILVSKDDDLVNEIKSKKYKFITVLYTDVKGLTELAQKSDAESLIDELDRFYFHFDTVLEKYNIKKIKSVGDTYICAGGFPEKNKINPVYIIMVAIEMQQYLKKIKKKYLEKEQKLWDITFGIHTGPALVINQGRRKEVYDLSGDTIHIASRIESSCAFGAISISAKTYEHVKDFFVCEYKGKLPVKYKGELALYTVKGYRPELSIEGKGYKHNERFWAKFQMYAFDDLNETIIEFLESKLPLGLKYHDIKHTIDVSIAVEIIGATEGVSEEDLLLLKTAALFHDSGLIYTFENHEEKSIEIAKKYLPKVGYKQEQISKINELIMATKNPLNADNLLEKIICDADYEYLGRYDLIEILRNRFHDFKLEYKDLDYKTFLENEKKLLESYDFYTQSANDMKATSKKDQLKLLKQEIKDSMNRNEFE